MPTTEPLNRPSYPSCLRELPPGSKGPKQTDMRSSGASTLQACARRFMFEYRFGLHRKGPEARPLSLGKFAHLLLGHAMVHGSLDGYDALLAKHLDGVRQTILSNPDSALSAGAIMAESTEDAQKAAALVAAFLPHIPYKPETHRLIAVEPFIRAQIHPFVTKIAGRLDFIFEDIQSGDLIVADLKTAGGGRKPIEISRTFTFSPQLRVFYACLLRAVMMDRSGTLAQVTPGLWGGDLQELRGMDPNRLKRIHYIILRKPSIKFCKKDRTFADYLLRVRDKYAEELQDPTDPPFVISWTNVPDAILADPETQRQLEPFDVACTQSIRLPLFPKTLDTGWSCHSWGKLCPYAPLCETEAIHDTAWPALLENFYTQQFRDDPEVEEP